MGPGQSRSFVYQFPWTSLPYLRVLHVPMWSHTALPSIVFRCQANIPVEMVGNWLGSATFALDYRLQGFYFLHTPNVQVRTYESRY